MWENAELYNVKTDGKYSSHCVSKGANLEVLYSSRIVLVNVIIGICSCVGPP